MEIKKSLVPFLELNKDPYSFNCTIHHGENLYIFARQFYKILVMLADRFVALSDDQVNPEGYLPFEIYTQYGDHDDVLLLAGEVRNILDLEKEFERLYREIYLFILDDLRKLPPILALEQSYHLQHELKESYSFHAPQFLQTIFYFAINNLESSFLRQIEYFEKVLQLEKYKQFVHLKDKEKPENVHLTGMTPDEFEEVIHVFSKLSIFGNEEDNRGTLTNFFSGKPDVVEYVILKGTQKEIADIFISLLRNNRFTTSKKTELADWVKRKFRVVTNDKTCLFGDEAFKMKSQKKIHKRIKLSFIEYTKL